ncbi:MAG: ASCH domain-containing protein [Castellaniella sp.]|nr:ASCH domain-containing protein [Castellaniella sp.]
MGSTSQSHIVISLEERFAEGILDGHKLVELRRRPMRVEVGSTVWLYAKVPVGAIVGAATVKRVRELSVRGMWEKFKESAGLTRTEFFSYFSNVDRAYALELVDPTRLAKPVKLAHLREAGTGFHPPQFFLRVPNGGALAAVLSASSEGKIGEICQ